MSWSIEIPDAMAASLDELPHGHRGTPARKKLERAINAALDAEGWPQGDRGAIPIPTTHWYVNVWNRDGSLHGHVGPIHDNDKAKAVARSWRSTGRLAIHTKRFMGKPLTQPGFS